MSFLHSQDRHQPASPLKLSFLIAFFGNISIIEERIHGYCSQKQSCSQRTSSAVGNLSVLISSFSASSLNYWSYSPSRQQGIPGNIYFRSTPKGSRVADQSHETTSASTGIQPDIRKIWQEVVSRLLALLFIVSHQNCSSRSQECLKLLIS